MTAFFAYFLLQTKREGIKMCVSKCNYCENPKSRKTTKHVFTL